MTNQAFLARRRHQLPGLVEDAAAAEATGIARPGAVGGIEQPLIGTQVAMEP